MNDQESKKSDIDVTVSSPMPEAHVTESVVVKPKEDHLRYRVSVAYLPELFLYLVLLGGLTVAVDSLVNLAWGAVATGSAHIVASSTMIVSALAGFLVTLPVVLWLGLRTANAEHLQSWRTQQKWRRVFYGVFMIVAVLAIVSSLMKAITALISWCLGLSVSSANIVVDFLGIRAPMATEWWIQAGSALTSALLIALVLYGASREYALSWRRYTKFALVVLGLTGAILGGALSWAVYANDCVPRGIIPLREEDLVGANPNWQCTSNTVVPDYKY